MDSDSDLSSDSDVEVDGRVAELEGKLLESPYSYEDHVELIGLLRKQGDLGKAREARQSMSKLFPLTEELWLEWLSDEVPLCGLELEEIAFTQQLFQSATQDYLSVMVWHQYTQFAMDKLSAMPEGFSFPRGVFERAIVGCGLHVAQSGLIWDAYVTMEAAVLTSLQAGSGGEADIETRQLIESQKERVQKLFKRCLSVSHVGMEKALEQYISIFPECDITESSVPGYSRAKNRLDEYLPFENSLLVSDPPPLDCYRSYLDHLTSSKSDPFLINNLYQRAVAHHSLDTQLWKDYLAFLDGNFSTAGSVLIPGYRLAVRSCPWEVSFWLGLVTGLERNNNSHDTIVETFESSLVDTFSGASDYLSMWTAYVDYYRRRVTSDSREGEEESDEGARKEELMEMFTRARNKLKKDFGIDGDPRDMLSRYHANMTPDAAEGRGIWDNIMTRHGREAHYWLDYITYMRSRQCENCRRYYQQAVNSVTDDPGRVCEAYLQFEREEGTLETYETAVKRTKAQMDRIKDRQQAAAEKGPQKREQPWWKEKERPKKPPPKDRKKDGGKPQPYQQQAGKKKESKGPGKKTVSGNREKLGSGSTGEGHRKRKAAVMEDGEGRDGMEARKQPRVDSKGDSITPRVALPKREEPGVVSMDTSATETESQRPQAVGKKEERTVFVSNLPPAITEDQLKHHFKQCGDIDEVRLIHSKRGLRVNTFAYIEFFESPSVWKALNLDRCSLMDRNIYVSPFKEQGGGGVGGEGDKTGTRPARSYDNTCTVYVNNLQRDVTEDVLLDLFKQCGEVKEVRLIKGKNGRPKGYAYVEYKDKVSAQEAVKQLDSHQMGLKQISVAMSAPRRPAEDQSVPEGVARSEGRGRGVADSDGGFLKPTFVPRRVVQQADDAPEPRRSKSKLMLVPRVVATGGGGGGAEDKPQEQPSKGKLSNDDFRKLFSSSKPT